jgi:gluconate 2-dehydrogenase subunit 3-like protein
MSEINRREALKALATAAAVPVVAPVAGALEVHDEAVARARAAADDAVRAAVEQGVPYTPKFFTAHEWATLALLVDYIIPRDARSGSATDAGVPEYIDFLMFDQVPAPRTMAPSPAQLAVRGGFAWLDGECRRRFDGKPFTRCTDAERRQVLDDIAWPGKARPELSHGVAFFTRMRDMTGAGFFSSRMGVKDLQYTGNIVRAEWTGCPDAVVRRLGVSYSAE